MPRSRSWGTGLRCLLASLVLPVIACGGRTDGEGAASLELDGSKTPSSHQQAATEAPLAEFVDVTITGETFELELAADVPTRQRGLMYRDHIDRNGGMLFAFPRPDFQEFWMGWCHVDIDIIYLDERARVTAFHQMKAESPQQPGETEEEYRERLPRYPSRLPAQFVVELAGGALDLLEIAVGDTIAIDHAELRRIAR